MRRRNAHEGDSESKLKKLEDLAPAFPETVKGGKTTKTQKAYDDMIRDGQLTADEYWSIG